MIKIFAKKGTTEKVAIMCESPQIEIVQMILNRRLKGDWYFVDIVQSHEILLFQDGLKYDGFSPDQERYCDGVTPI